MPTLRDIVDGKVIWAQSPVPPPKKKTPPSPAAQHVGNHLQDPFGATKDMIDELNQAKMNYEQTKSGAIMKLLPVQSVLDGITESHALHTPDANPMDEQMGYQDPNDPMATAGAGGAPMPGQPPMGGKPMMPPQNMTQSPGALNQNRPSQTGFQPGVAPGFPSQQVVPGKFGMPQPGTSQLGKKAGMPNPQQDQFNPQAQPPNGAKQLPGAKGPNDPKVQGQVKKAQGNSNGGSGKPGSQGSKGKVNIQVHADRATSTSSPLSAWAGLDTLRSCNTKKMEAGGPGSGRRPGQGAEREDWRARQQMWKRIRQRDPDWKNEMSGGTFKPFGKMKAYTGSGMSSQNKNTTTTFVSKGPGNVPGAGNSMPANKMRAYGTSEGVRKAWESRGHGKSEPNVEMNQPRGTKDRDAGGWEGKRGRGILREALAPSRSRSSPRYTKSGPDGPWNNYGKTFKDDPAKYDKGSKSGPDGPWNNYGRKFNDDPADYDKGSKSRSWFPGPAGQARDANLRAGVEKQGWVRPTYPDTPAMTAKKKKRMEARMVNLTQ